MTDDRRNAEAAEAAYYEAQLGQRLAEDSVDNTALFEGITALAHCRAWQYVRLLGFRALVDLRLAQGEPAQSVIDDWGAPLHRALADCQQISQALTLTGFMTGLPNFTPAEREERAAAVVDRLAAPMAPLSSRRWTLPGSRRLDAATLRTELLALHRRASFIPGALRAEWLGRKAADRLSYFNKRIRDDVLVRLVKQNNRALWSRWDEVAKLYPPQAVLLRVNYDAINVKATLAIGGKLFKSKAHGPFKYINITGMTAQDYFDARDEQLPFIRHVSNLCCTLLSACYAHDSATFLSASGVFYRLFLQDILTQPEVVAALEALGERPTLVVSTHGALQHIPFAAVFDGERYMADRFDVAQVSPVFDDRAGNMDFDGLLGRPNLKRPLQINAAVDEVGLEQGWAENEAYREVADRLGLKLALPEERLWGVEALESVLAKPGVGVISCHVAADPSDALGARVRLPNGDEVTLADVMAKGVSSDVLVLAGCYSASQTDWVAASGHSNAAHHGRQAGASTVITTLWPIDDLAGRVFNAAFVEALAGGMSRAEAHGAAQRAVRGFRPNLAQLAGMERKGGSRSPLGVTRTDFDQPYYWAPFVLTGAWS